MDEVDDLLVDELLIGLRCVQAVEQQNVDRIALGYGRAIGKGLRG